MRTAPAKPSPPPGPRKPAARVKSAARPLRVLIVEDSESDAALLELELQRAGYQPACERVETRQAMAAALDRGKWDLVVADYVLPRFNGLEALRLLRERDPDVPLIIVSGHISDGTAVAAMKAGAHDYVMKDNLTRLGPAVQRELRDAAARQEQRRGEEKLLAERGFREAIETSVPAGIAAVDLEGRQTYVNPAFCAMLGWSEKELLGARPPFVYWPPEDIDSITGQMTAVIQGRAPVAGIEQRFRRRTGERIHVLLQVTPLKDHFDNLTGWVSSVSDISERQRAETRIAAEHAITRILHGAASLEEAGPGILRVLLGALEVEFGALWVMDAAGRNLAPAAFELHTRSDALQKFLEASAALTFKPGEGLPGRVWRRRQPIWIEEVPGETLLRAGAAAAAGLRSALAFPALSADETFGVFEFFSLRTFKDDPTLVRMLTAIGLEIGQFVHRRQAEEGLRRARDELEARVQQRTEQLNTANLRLHAAISERRRLEQELLEITEKERRRIGLDLHDDLGQKLSGVALMMKGLELKLARRNPAEAREAGKIHDLVHQAMNHASDLARDMATLDTARRDLPGALRDLAGRVRELYGVPCKFSAEGAAPALDPSTITQLHKIAQEAVTNAIKHGKARRVDLLLAGTPGQLALSVHNTGLPFPDLQDNAATGMGLRIMNYRASLLGATLQIKAAPGGRGTIVTCLLPLENPSPRNEPGHEPPAARPAKPPAP